MSHYKPIVDKTGVIGIRCIFCNNWAPEGVPIGHTDECSPCKWVVVMLCREGIELRGTEWVRKWLPTVWTFSESEEDARREASTIPVSKTCAGVYVAPYSKDGDHLNPPARIRRSVRGVIL